MQPIGRQFVSSSRGSRIDHSSPPQGVDMGENKLACFLAVLVVFSTIALPVRSEEDKSARENALLDSGPVNRDAKSLSPPTTITGEGKDTFTETTPKLVLALSGGAIKAVAEIGVLRSFEQHHIKIDGIVGTSMGATIGSLYCAGMPLDDIEKLFTENTIQTAMLKGAVFNIITKPLAPLTYIFKGKPYAGITDGKGYLKLLKKHLPAKFEGLKIPFAAVVTNLTDGQTVVLGHGDLPLAVLASNCVPTLYRPLMIDGKLYVDGGLKANLPSDIAQSMGAADMVVGVLVDTAVKSVPNPRFKSKKALIIRVMNIMMASSDKMQTKSSDILIYPNVDSIPALTSDPAIIKKGIAAGQEAGDSVAPKIIAQRASLGQISKVGTKPQVETSIQVDR